MSLSDLINSIFEVSGGVFVWFNIRQILKDKEVKGFHWLPMMFFTGWGFWNMYYYFHLLQWMSLCGAFFTCGFNSVYLALIFKYKNRNHEEKGSSRTNK